MKVQISSSQVSWKTNKEVQISFSKMEYENEKTSVELAINELHITSPLFYICKYRNKR